MTSLQDLSPNSRIWIYQGSREFTSEEAFRINRLAAEFVTNWDSHGTRLKAAAEIYFNRFIIIGVDDKQVALGGCSIDSSVAFIKKIENDFNVDLLDRMLVAYRDEGKIKTCKLPQITQLLENSEITENTVIFNNLVSTKKDWEDKWQIALKDSWILQGVN